MEAASIAHGAHDPSHGDADSHHGPIEANHSSRVDAPTLGMLLFIISEIMIFGAFFTAYFFIRVAQGDPWPAPGTTIPIAVAGFNTAILISSSFTLHWAEISIKRGNRIGLRAGILSTLLLGATFLFIQINEYVHLGFAPQRQRPGHDLLRPHRPARRPRLHRSDPALDRDDPSLPRPLLPGAAQGPERARASTGTSST